MRRIEMLFEKGGKAMVFPFSIRYLVVPADTLPATCQTLISVSKRRFRHAVDRNRVKRLMRETFRTRKQQLYVALDNRQLLLSISYVHTQIYDYGTFDRKMQKAIEVLIEKLRQS